jgi:hypothetical protein
MGLTREDRHRIFYHYHIKHGLTAKEAMMKFPKHMRKRAKQSVSKGYIETHYGVKPLTFAWVLLIWTVAVSSVMGYVFFR